MTVRIHSDQGSSSSSSSKKKRFRKKRKSTNLTGSDLEQERHRSIEMHNTSSSHSSCSTHVYMISKEAMQERKVSSDNVYNKASKENASVGNNGGGGSVGGSERSYVYLPTECQTKMQNQMAEKLKSSFENIRIKNDKRKY